MPTLTPTEPPPTSTVPDPPSFAQWKTQVPQWATIHGNKFLDPSLNASDQLGLCYYDTAWIYRNINTLFPNDLYVQVRDLSIKFYRDGYVNTQYHGDGTPNFGGVAGWMIFPHGLYYHYQDTKDEVSKQALLDLAAHASFTSWGEITNPDYLPALNSSREAAYVLAAKLYAKRLGQDDGLLQLVRDDCLGHLRMWRAILDGTNANPGDGTNGTKLEDVRSFMVGLTCHSLIEYVVDHPDQTQAIKDEITKTLNLLWDKAYDPATQALAYTDRVIPGVGDRNPAPDVSMLIAPAYAWIGQRDRADQLFEGNVLRGYWYGDKQFNQAMRYAVDYLEWRKQ